jgi:prepilin-type N-terminal cleavage/methylation domain-containing protein
MHHARHLHSASKRRAFTLIEVVIVVLIISLMAGLIIPRLGGVGRRAEQLAVDRVADLLAAFSYRDSLASGSTAIEYSANQGSLTLLTLRRPPETPEDPPIWMRDVLAPVIRIPDTIVMNAYEDGAILPNGDWSLITNLDGTRPKIEIELSGSTVNATVMLDPWAQTPAVVDENNPAPTTLLDAIDLDAVGQDKDPW